MTCKFSKISAIFTSSTPQIANIHSGIFINLARDFLLFFVFIVLYVYFNETAVYKFDLYGVGEQQKYP